MPTKYTKSKRADRDIKRIIIHSLAEFGELQTDKYAKGLEKTLQHLADAPEIGRIFLHGETNREYRQYAYVSHTIFYRQREEDIFIVRILHSRMFPEKHL